MQSLPSAASIIYEIEKYIAKNPDQLFPATMVYNISSVDFSQGLPTWPGTGNVNRFTEQIFIGVTYAAGHAISIYVSGNSATVAQWKEIHGQKYEKE